mgnify:CR=1 FL=1
MRQLLPKDIYIDFVGKRKPALFISTLFMLAFYFYAPTSIVPHVSMSTLTVPILRRTTTQKEAVKPSTGSVSMARASTRRSAGCWRRRGLKPPQAGPIWRVSRE